ncbi:hypothetical protein JCM11641_001039 [Rhodosporidiobolus odoratus]
MSTQSPYSSPALSTTSTFHSSSTATANTLSAPREALQPYQTADTSVKVVVRFKATGNAPILKQTVYKLAGSHKFERVIAFLRKELGSKPSEALFLYINSSFSPAPDDTVANLTKCFGGTDGVLTVHYSSTQAWG